MSSRRERMVARCVLAVLCALCGQSVFAGTDATPAPPQCRVAVVNPVSGYAECVEPRGAPVDQPPPRPPPTPEQCAQHPELDLEACRKTQPPHGC